jgi:rod shape-determining protein MreB
MLVNFANLFNLNIGVDFGSFKTRAVNEDLGNFYDKPTLISIYKKDKNVLAVGESSKEMIGRVPLGVEVIRPIQNSEINSNFVFELYVKDLIKEISEKNKLFKLVTKPTLFIPVNSDFTKAQLANYENSLKKEGVLKVRFLKKSLVISHGLPKKSQQKSAKLIIDMGYSKTDIGVVFNDVLVDGKTLNFGGNDINKLIYQRLIEEKKIQVSDENIENMKISSLILYPNQFDTEKFEIIGKSTKTGLPHKVEMSYLDFREMVIPLIKSNFINPLKSFINTFTENISNDVYQNGVELVGGGSQIYSLKLLLSKEFNMKFNVSKNPEKIILSGLKEVIKNKEIYTKLSFE